MYNATNYLEEFDFAVILIEKITVCGRIEVFDI